MRQAVSPVETRDEAIALLILQNGVAECSEDNVRPEGDGWVFRTRLGMPSSRSRSTRG